jgi:hypothetical protein
MLAHPLCGPFAISRIAPHLPDTTSFLRHSYSALSTNWITLKLARAKVSCLAWQQYIHRWEQPH